MGQGVRVQVEISVFLDFRWCWMYEIFMKQRNLTDTSHEN